MKFTEVDRNNQPLKSESEEFAMKWVFREEFKLLARIAGLKILHEFSNFKKDPPCYGEEQIYILEKNELNTYEENLTTS